MSDLLIGCGNSRVKRVRLPHQPEEFEDLVTVDIDPDSGADVLHDLNETPWPFDDNQFDSVHAYEVLEHIGFQGDYYAFFAHFSEMHRILKDGGYVFATCPSYKSMWAWGDPGHTRVITSGSLAFLSQKQYEKQVGKTAMTDYRSIYKADFDVWDFNETDEQLTFVLRAVKSGKKHPWI